MPSWVPLPRSKKPGARLALVSGRWSRAVVGGGLHPARSGTRTPGGGAMERQSLAAPGCTTARPATRDADRIDKRIMELPSLFERSQEPEIGEFAAQDLGHGGEVARAAAEIARGVLCLK